MPETAQSTADSHGEVQRYMSNMEYSTLTRKDRNGRGTVHQYLAIPLRLTDITSAMKSISHDSGQTINQQSRGVKEAMLTRGKELAQLSKIQRQRSLSEILHRGYRSDL